MFLVKNKLKKIKKRIDDDDEYLNYLKYSHLNTSKKPRVDKEDDTEKNETHNLQLANIEPKKIDTANKGVDTGNDFEKIVPPHVSFMHSEDFDRNEKMVQVWTKMFKQNLTPPPSSSSSSSSNNSEGFLSKTARRGFRLAEFALNTAITGANLTMAVSDALVNLTSAPHQSSEEELVNNPEVISIHSSPPISVNSSSSSDVEQVPIEISSSSSRQTPSSIPAPTSPQSSKASSAKTTPRKTSK